MENDPEMFQNPLLLPRMVWQVALGVTLILIVVWLMLKLRADSRMKRRAGKEQDLKKPIEEGDGPDQAAIDNEKR